MDELVRVVRAMARTGSRAVFRMLLWAVAFCDAAALADQPACPDVLVSEAEVRVSFPGAPVVAAVLAVENGEITGLSRIAVDGADVLAPPASGFSTPVMRRLTGGAIAPVTDLAAYLAERGEIGDRYTFPARGEILSADIPLRGRLVGWHQQGEAVVVETALSHGRAEWWLSRASTRTYGGSYAGASWQLKLYGLDGVYEIDVDEPVAFAEGDWRLQQRGNQSDDKNEEEFRLSFQTDPEHSYSMSNRKYGARQQPFFFLAGTRGATLSYFNSVSCAEVGEGQRDGRIVLHSRIPVRPDAEGCIATPVKSWLFRAEDLSGKWDAINEWTWSWDRVVGDLHARMDMELTEPLPTLFHQQFVTPGLEYGLTPALRKSMDPPAFEDSWLRRFADDVIPKAASWGIGAVELRAVLDSDIDHADEECPRGSFAQESVCGPWGLRISPKLGGEAGLAYVVTKAHAHGMKVAIWSAPAHQSVCSPAVREHPEWLMFNADGRLNNRGYVTLAGMDLATSFRAYMEQAYGELRARTGLDGVWADSYCAFGADRNMIRAAPYPQLDEAIALQRAMQRLGYSYLMKEDCGPFGISTRSSGLNGILGREYLRYYFLYNHSDPSKRYDPDSYFRSLACKGVLEIRVPREFEAQPAEARDRIVRANFVYREVLPLLKHRHVIGSGNAWQGVAWADNTGRMRVLFCFEPFDWPAPEGAAGQELMTGEPFRASGGAVRAEPWRIYRLDLGAPGNAQ